MVSVYILGYLSELIIKIWLFGKKIPSKFGEFGPFFQCKILLISRNNIFQVEILPIKNKTLI
jgi:hypothetical protein